ncbi:hypothetical protein QBC38DRAFT_364524 [Podospora fimiseda]|uniref:Uncharacterized protein n=1 Tax=Podospora fimiseda TaxID=252190 RepID=A0AAN7BPV5_9PEZI|nr:hypothetical protein QBC38DRAFT_364524 [Podospora fimiseda]
MPGPQRKPSPIEPIMLWGFCFSTQAKQNFNTPWGAAWLTNQYTDERHEMWEHIAHNDLAKKREIKYGNNVAVLFGALVECKAFWGHDGFWHAIARGFNTNSTILRCTVEILTDARRIQRGKPAKEISDTARAADRWIAFLDSDAARLKHRGDGPESALIRIADAYFKKQERAWVNAAWVPINPKGDTTHNRAPSPPRIKHEPGMGDIHGLHVRSASVRKRSPSAAPLESRIKKRRMSFVSGAGDPLPPTGPRRYSRDHDYTAHKPDPDYHQQGPGDWDRSRDRNAESRDILPLSSRQDRDLRLDPPPLHVNGAREPAPVPRDDKTQKELQARISNLEKELAQAKMKLKSTTPTTTGSSNQLAAQMNSVTDAVSTMMDSMHDIVDGLTRLQDEVSVVSSKQTTVTNLSPDNSIDKLSKLVLDPLAAITDTLASIQSEVAELKKAQSSLSPAQAPPPDLTELKSILKQQSDQIAALNQSMACIQRQSPKLPPPTAQTLQQAITNAERDLWHHYSAVSDFYNKLDINKASRATTERTAEFLAVLQHSVESAKAMKGGGGSGASPHP